MMLFLPGDISAHRVNLREPDGKDAALPGEVREFGRLLFKPDRRTAFEFFDDVRNSAGSCQIKEQVNVILDTSHD